MNIKRNIEWSLAKFSMGSLDPSLNSNIKDSVKDIGGLVIFEERFYNDPKRVFGLSICYEDEDNGIAFCNDRAYSVLESFSEDFINVEISVYSSLVSAYGTRLKHRDRSIKNFGFKYSQIRELIEFPGVSFFNNYDGNDGKMLSVNILYEKQAIACATPRKCFISDNYNFEKNVVMDDINSIHNKLRSIYSGELHKRNRGILFSGIIAKAIGI